MANNDDLIITDHSRFEMDRRDIGEDVVRRVAGQPEQVVVVRAGREVRQLRMAMGEPPTDYLVRVIVDVDRSPVEVVTVYRTSKIERYWRPEK